MNQKLEVTISSSSRCEDWVDCLFKGQISPNWEAIYIASSSSSSHNANFVKALIINNYVCYTYSLDVYSATK